MNVTPIEWTDFSANPVKYRDADGRGVWACVHASPGCQNCYAESIAERFGKGGPFNVPTTAKVTPFLDEKELRQMLTAKRIGKVDVAGSRCFVGDMTDIFGEWVPDALLDRLFAVFALRPDVTFQILTKRARRMRRWFDVNSTGGHIFHVSQQLDPHRRGARSGRWPLPNVWLGVSCEDQQRADERIPQLLRTPAAVRFISAEPLLGQVEVTGALTGHDDGDCPRSDPDCLGGDGDSHEACESQARLDWVIVGGESGAGARPCHVDWIRSLVGQCRKSGVSCFVKQLGSNILCADTHFPFPSPARYVHSEVRDYGVRLSDRKGSNMSEWPEDLRVREYPRATVSA